MKKRTKNSKRFAICGFAGGEPLFSFIMFLLPKPQNTWNVCMARRIFLLTFVSSILVFTPACSKFGFFGTSKVGGDPSGTPKGNQPGFHGIIEGGEFGVVKQLPSGALAPNTERNDPQTVIFTLTQSPPADATFTIDGLSIVPILTQGDQVTVNVPPGVPGNSVLQMHSGGKTLFSHPLSFKTADSLVYNTNDISIAGRWWYYMHHGNSQIANLDSTQTKVVVYGGVCGFYGDRGGDCQNLPSLRSARGGAVYDGVTGQWTRILPTAEAPFGTFGFIAATPEKAFFFFRSYFEASENRVIHNFEVSIYDFSTKTWSQGTPCPAGNDPNAFTAYTVNSNPFSHGAVFNPETNSVFFGQYLYELGSDKWIYIPPPPGNGTLNTNAVNAGKDYAIYHGGGNSDIGLDLGNRTTLFNFHTRAWGRSFTTVEAPSPRDGANIFYLANVGEGGSMLVYGGRGSTNGHGNPSTDSNAYLLDLKTDSWSKLTLSGVQTDRGISMAAAPIAGGGDVVYGVGTASWDFPTGLFGFRVYPDGRMEQITTGLPPVSGRRGQQMVYLPNKNSFLILGGDTAIGLIPQLFLPQDF